MPVPVLRRAGSAGDHRSGARGGSGRVGAAASLTRVSVESADPVEKPRRRAAARGGSAYSAKHLSVLEGLEAVRKRPGMYIGSTDGRGLMHCLWEILDNSVDEALAGHCHAVEVVLAADGSVEVRDDGRGIPVDVEPKTRLSGVEVVMTKLHAGGKFGGGSYGASGGLHGVGASVVNALSARLDVEVDRDGKTHAISFRRGVPGVFDGDGPDAEFTRRSGLRVIGTVPRRRTGHPTGTRVRWWRDPQIFTGDARYDLDGVRERVRQTTFLVPGLTIALRDERGPGDPVVEEHRHDGGLSDFVVALADGEPVTGVLRLTGTGHFHETVPVLDRAGHLVSQAVERELGVDVALQWSTGYDADIRSFVNVVATPKGGTHVAGFERALVGVLNDAVKNSKLVRNGEERLSKDDVTEGLTAVVTVRLAEPQFEGQTKEILGTPAASRIVSHVVTRELGAWIATPPRGDKAIVRATLDKVVGAMRARVAARAHRDVQRRKTALESSAMPAKLVDCRSDDVERTELFIVEGDSALGTAKMARDSEFQALLPIRGKILNVQKSSVGDMLKNAECASIIQVVGAGSGRSFDLESARYQKVILMADADVDGSHIRCLLLTLMHRYLQPLLEAGRVFAAVPPLHRVEIVGGGGKRNEVRYTYSDNELQRVLAEAGSQGRRVKDPVQRYKGLGEMDAAQLRETTMSPGSRTLRRITAADADAAGEVFSLLMGSEVAPRKEFIVAGAATMDRSRLDL
ncbi:MAG: type IIA DNA topoisomerase subunit B [Actinomycetota bacterium]|nr:MAG: type IIA DNA topoisomerase subunit B [Actinomycetota bacterium]